MGQRLGITVQGGGWWPLWGLDNETMGQRLGITVQGVGWWPFWGLNNPLGVHSDIFEGFHSEITRTLHLDQNHRPRFSSAEANRASDKPGCNLDSTCSTNLLVMPGLLRSANSKAFFNSSTASV